MHTLHVVIGVLYYAGARNNTSAPSAQYYRLPVVQSPSACGRLDTSSSAVRRCMYSALPHD